MEDFTSAVMILKTGSKQQQDFDFQQIIRNDAERNYYDDVPEMPS